jgi:hypothetical protein
MQLRCDVFADVFPHVRDTRVAFFLMRGVFHRRCVGPPNVRHDKVGG